MQEQIVISVHIGNIAYLINPGYCRRLFVPSTARFPFPRAPFDGKLLYSSSLAINKTRTGSRPNGGVLGITASTASNVCGRGRAGHV